MSTPNPNPQTERNIVTENGFIVQIDGKNHEKLSRVMWNTRVIDGMIVPVVFRDEKMIQMKDYLLDSKEGDVTGYKNGNGLDNRESNILHDKGKRKVDKSLRGVYKEGGKVKARIVVQGSIVDLGEFDNEDDAADAYDIAAVNHFGDAAITNRGNQ